MWGGDGTWLSPIVAMLERVQQDGYDSGDFCAMKSLHSPVVGNWFGISETMCAFILPWGYSRTADSGCDHGVRR